MELEISPAPDAAERAAILAALAADQEESPVGSAWARALLPRREGDEDPRP